MDMATSPLTDRQAGQTMTLDDGESAHPRTVLVDIVTEYIDADGDSFMTWAEFDYIADSAINATASAGDIE